MKTCCTCKEKKDLKYFYVSKATSDGLQPRCKLCNNTANKKVLAGTKEQFKALRSTLKAILNTIPIKQVLQSCTNEDQKNLIIKLNNENKVSKAS